MLSCIDQDFDVEVEINKTLDFSRIMQLLNATKQAFLR